VDSVPLVFFLASLILFLKYTHSRKLFFYPLSLFCFAVSLLTKEMAVTLPLIIVAIDYLFLSKRNAKGVFKNFLHLHLSFFIVLGIYLAVRYYVVGLPFGIEGGERYVRNFSLGIAPFWRVFTVLKIFTLYIRLLFFPYGLKAEYLFPASDSFFDPVVLTGFILLVLFIYLVLKNTQRFPIVSFSITWFFITALPISNIIPQGNIFAERYMYMPSVGFCIGMGFLFSWLLKKDIKTSFFPPRKSITLVSILLIVALGRVTYERNKVWKNDLVLWRDTVEATPNSPVAHANLASAYLNINLLDQAIEEINKTIELNPYDYQFLNILGHINLKKGLHDEAIKAFKMATDLGPDYAETHHNLATAYGLKGDYSKAIKAGLTALEKNPYLDDARYNLALSYKKSGLINEAIQTYEEYLDTNSIYIGVHLDVGYLYYERGDYQKAKEHWLTALEISPDYQPAKEALKLLEE